jgi:hypothetical protein
MSLVSRGHKCRSKKRKREETLPNIDSTKATKESPPKQNGKPYNKIKVT